MRGKRVIQELSRRMIRFILRVLLSAAHRLWRVDVDSIAAAMTHSYSFFAAPCWGAPMKGYLGMAFPEDSFGAAKNSGGRDGGTVGAVFGMSGVRSAGETCLRRPKGMIPLGIPASLARSWVRRAEADEGYGVGMVG